MILSPFQLACSSVRFRALVVLGVFVSSLTVMALPAQGCTVGGPLPLSVMLEEDMLQYDYGIYEQQTIASAPSVLIRDGATASVVTRYWGRPPATLSVQYERGKWFSWFKNTLVGGRNSCDGILDDDGNRIARDGSTGTIGYGIAPPPEDAEGPLSPEEAAAQGTVPWYRTAPFLTMEDGDKFGPLSANELAALEAAYGPATFVEIESRARFWATVTVWWPTVLGLVVVGMVVAVISYRIWFRQLRDSAEQPSLEVG